jgi:hypothetical protein
MATTVDELERALTERGTQIFARRDPRTLVWSVWLDSRERTVMATGHALCTAVQSALIQWDSSQYAPR